MSYSRYITSGTTTTSGGLVHTVSNPANASFSWLAAEHIEIYLSTAGQALSAFTTAITNGEVNKFNTSDGYTLVGTTLTFSGLTASSTYHFQIRRVTPKLTHFVDFTAGSPLTEIDLDNSNRWALYRTQEVEDSVTFTLTLENMKTVAGITGDGDFVFTTDTQTITNKTFTAGTAITSSFDLGTASWQ
jgi:hypothetical protein